MLARLVAPLKQYHDELETRAAELALQVEEKTLALARLRGDDADDDVEDESLAGWEEDEPPVRDLFTPAMMPSPEAVLASTLQKTSLDLAAMAREHADDPLAFAKLVNYIRRSRAAGETDAAVVANVRGGRWRDDANAKPFDAEDALLWWDPFEAAADEDAPAVRAEEAHAELVAAAAAAAPRAPFNVAAPSSSSDYYYASYSHIDIHEEMLRAFSPTPPPLQRALTLGASRRHGAHVGVQERPEQPRRPRRRRRGLRHGRAFHVQRQGRRQGGHCH